MAKAWIEEPAPEPVIEWTITVSEDSSRAAGFYVYEVVGKSLLTDAKFYNLRGGYISRHGAAEAALAHAESISSLHRLDQSVPDKQVVRL